jgi:hypothetical protein
VLILPALSSIVAMSLAATQIAPAGSKKTSTTTKGSFEIKDFSFGVENPATIRARERVPHHRQE